MNSVTIIGTGLAGYNLAKEIRKLDKEIALTLITADGGESYSKPMLSNALSKGKTAQQLVISDPEKMAGQLDAKIFTRTTVHSIDPENKIINTESDSLSYDNLVLAIGAHQNKLPISGNAADSILSINNLDDYGKFREKLANAGKVSIIGAGLIGCEFANDLLAADKQVTIIGSSKTPLDRLLLPEIGQLLKDRLQAKGVNWRLGVKAKAINLVDAGANYAVELSDGSSINADIVISATGLSPNIELAKRANLKVKQGILVNQYMETSSAGIYALGDCIEIDGLVMAYVLPIMNAARALAKTLTGQTTKVIYPAMPIVVKTPDYPMVIAPPAENVSGQWQVQHDSSGCKALFMGEDEKLKGFILTEGKMPEKQALTKQLGAILN